MIARSGGSGTDRIEPGKLGVRKGSGGSLVWAPSGFLVSFNFRDIGRQYF